MGYKERCCQICGVRFNLGRIRRIDEPLLLETAWNSFRGPKAFRQSDDDDGGNYDDDIFGPSMLYVTIPKDAEPHPACIAAGCSNAQGDHAAGGPGCGEIRGYNGWCISPQEMEMMMRVQCIVEKEYGWEPEPDDQDFEIKSPFAFLTAISPRTAEERSIERVPYRHGVGGSLMISNTDGAWEWYMPVHPPCFEVFRHVSMARYDYVDLWALIQFRRDLDVHSIPRHPHVKQCTNNFWQHIPGTEYLAADPQNIPRLHELLDQCAFLSDTNEMPKTSSQTRSSDFSDSSAAGNPPQQHQQQQDPFQTLPIEVIFSILEFIQDDYRAVANLRLSSPTFKRLPQSFFRNLIRKRMPWVWEVDDPAVRPQAMNWHKLWNELCQADGGKHVTITEKEKEKKSTACNSSSGSGSGCPQPTESCLSLQTDCQVPSEREQEAAAQDNGERNDYNNYFFRGKSSRLFRWTPHEELDGELVGRDSELWSKAACVRSSDHGRDKTILGLRNRRRIWNECHEIFNLFE